LVVSLIIFIILIGAIASVPYLLADIQIESPRKQMEHGVLAYDVKCKTGLQLALRVSDGSAVCLMPPHIQLLIERGWAMMVSKENVKNPNQSQPSNNMSQTTLSSTSSANNMSRTIPSTNKQNLEFLIYAGSAQYNDNMKVFSKYLKNGDYLLIHGSKKLLPDITQKVQSAKSSMVNPGVNVLATIQYVTISKITNGVPNLPACFDIIAYDYENWSSTPEFTTNETQALKYFDQAETAVHQYNQQMGCHAMLMVDPAYKQLPGWDWSQVGKHADYVNIQYGGYTTSSNLGQVVTAGVSSLKQVSPSTLVSAQISLLRGTPIVISDDIKNIYAANIPVNAIFVYFTSGQTAELQSLFTTLYGY
jgi:hypothetical protein